MVIQSEYQASTALTSKEASRRQHHPCHACSSSNDALWSGHFVASSDALVEAWPDAFSCKVKMKNLSSHSQIRLGGKLTWYNVCGVVEGICRYTEYTHLFSRLFTVYTPNNQNSH